MGTLDRAKDAPVTAEVVHFGDKITLPDIPRRMKIPEAISVLERRMKYENETVIIKRSFNVFPWDGAIALDFALTKTFGWTPQEPTPGFFGPEPPKMIDVQISLTESRNVPWGKFSLPGIDGGSVQTGFERNGARFVFTLSASVMRQHEPAIKKLFDLVDETLKTNSIYRGKAVRVRFCDDDGEALPMPEIGFIDTKIDENQLVYSKHIQDSIRTNLFTPILKHAELAANGLRFKRGVLLGGVYGTGKTLAAKVASKHAISVGLTYIYVLRADELAYAVEFAKQYQSPASVLFCEDIDRAMVGDRSVKIDDILNIIDGVDSKNMNVMIVLTTNNLAGITKAMLRPGRLDAVIEVEAPDAEAVQRLLHVYGKDAIDPDADLSAVGKVLHGEIPATIEEVVKRAKLSQLALQEPGVRVTKLSSAALLDAARTMTAQLGLLKEKPVKEPAKRLALELDSDSLTALAGALLTAGLASVPRGTNDLEEPLPGDRGHGERILSVASHAD